MSHVVQTSCVIDSLDCLKQAAESLGLEFCQDVHHYRWFETSVGDFPLPLGFTAKDLGKCDHMIKVKGNSNAYQIGVCRRRDGQPGYTLLFDFWQGGYGLIDKIGKDAFKLTQAYKKLVTLNHLPFGATFSETTLDDGSIAVEIDTPDQEETAVQY